MRAEHPDDVPFKLTTVASAMENGESEGYNARRTMPHIFFFSYTHRDHDVYLEEFFEDLAVAVAGPTEFEAGDPAVSFRDTKDLAVMENWKTHIETALQSSAVLVCLTSMKYFNSEFCGKEYYVFDQRRRQGIAPGSEPPPNILPIVWYPVDGGLPAFMNDVQQTPKGTPSLYLERGLRHLRRFERDAYDRCVEGFAEAIRTAWKKCGKIKPLTDVKEFHDIPNAFAGGDWQEAAEPRGWKRGPEVVNFIFVAETRNDAPEPEGCHGEVAAEWRPYLPPEMTTILDYAQKAKKKQFLFREIRNDFDDELKSAKERLNLSVVIGSHKALVNSNFKDVRQIEQLWWDGTALLVPCSDTNIDDKTLRDWLKPAFPVLCSAQEQNFVGPIRSSEELMNILDATLSRMRNAVKSPEIQKKEKTDEPPPSVNGTPGARSG